MKFLQEVMRSVKRLPDPAPEEQSQGDLPIDPNAEEGLPADMPQDDLSPEVADELDTVVDSATEDPNKVGLIRTVRKAHLVYKRASDDGTFTELWLYNLQNMQQQTEIKRAILAGTDIPPNQTQSPDGAQSYSTWAVGNAEMIEITGLPS